jgi:hypothetical protein
MTSTAATFRVVRLMAIFSVLVGGGLLCLMIFNAATQPPPVDGPVEKWIRAGIDLHQLHVFESVNGIVEPEEFERVIEAAKEISRHSGFPGNEDAYMKYKQAREETSTSASILWVLIITCLTFGLCAFAWLHGATWAAAGNRETVTERTG